MKKCFFVALLLLTIVSTSSAQMAKWIMKPLYDTIFMPDGTDLIVTDSIGLYTTVWNTDGNKISQVNGYMHSFHNGMAVVTDKGNSRLLGFFLPSGEYVTAWKGDYSIIDELPYFNDGFLLVQELKVKEFFFRFVDKSGRPSEERFVKALPFCNGYASCKFIENPKKNEYTTPCLLDTNLKHVLFSFQGKQFREADVDFISSVNDENMAIVIAKNKAYIYFAGNNELQPLCATPGIDNYKEQVKLNDYLVKHLVRVNDSSWVLNLVGKKKKNVKVFFDDLMRVKSICYFDKEVFYYSKYVEPEKKTSPLRIIKKDDLCGLSWNNTEILPPQFEQVPLCFGDKAFVRKDGKYGLIQLFRDKQFKVSINKGDKIAFMHYKIPTNIRVDFPTFLPANKVEIDMEKSSKLQIDKTSVQYTNTPYGNFTQYDCNMIIPDTLFSVDSDYVKFFFKINYDGFVSPTIPVDVKVWLCRNLLLEVDPRIILYDGKASLNFIVKYSKDYGDQIYKIDVWANSDSVSIQSNSLTSYRCTLLYLKKDVNWFSIIVAEEGMPPTAFPIAIKYDKTEDEKSRNDVDQIVDVDKVSLQGVKDPVRVKPKDDGFDHRRL